MDYEVIDNFLPQPQFQDIQNLLLGKNFFWYYVDYVAGEGVEDTKLYYFMHTFFENHSIQSNQIHVVAPLIEKINPTAIIRAKANLYPNTNEHARHGMHRDLDTPHKGMVFYINTNNGFTVLEDGTKIESVANRVLLFDSSQPHCSTSCTDEKTRVTLNMNYF